MRSVAYFLFWERMKRKRKKVQENIGIISYNEFFLQLLSCTFDFLASFGMHGTCMWFLGYDMSLASRISWIEG